MYATGVTKRSEPKLQVLILIGCYVAEKGPYAIPDVAATPHNGRGRAGLF
jgi:hypothetical protein